MSDLENAIYNKSKQLKDTLISLLNTTRFGRYPWKLIADEYREREEAYDLDRRVVQLCFWVPEDEYYARSERQLQYNPSFCAVCGNYVVTYTDIPQHIKCNYDYCGSTFAEMKRKSETV